MHFSISQIGMARVLQKPLWPGRDFNRKVGLLCPNGSDAHYLLNYTSVNGLQKPCIQTAPLYKHAFFVSGITFESNHQPLNWSISENSRERNQGSDVCHVIKRNWLPRVHKVWLDTFEHEKCIVGQVWLSGKIHSWVISGKMRMLAGTWMESWLVIIWRWF